MKKNANRKTHESSGELSAQVIVKEALNHLSTFMFVKIDEDENQKVFENLITQYEQKRKAAFAFNAPLKDGTVIPIEIKIGPIPRSKKAVASKKAQAANEL